MCGLIVGLVLWLDVGCVCYAVYMFGLVVGCLGFLAFGGIVVFVLVFWLVFLFTYLHLDVGILFGWLLYGLFDLSVIGG